MDRRTDGRTENVPKGKGTADRLMPLGNLCVVVVVFIVVIIVVFVIVVFVVVVFVVVVFVVVFVVVLFLLFSSLLLLLNCCLPSTTANPPLCRPYK